jgi:hypothetical protein
MSVDMSQDPAAWAAQQATKQGDSNWLADVAASLQQDARYKTTMREHRARSGQCDRPDPLPPLDWPPGVAGQLAQLLYQSAIRPVREVSIATALGILAGMCGRGWNTHTGAGLNLYLAFVARSGVGKEAIADGIAMVIGAARRMGADSMSAYFTFDNLASGQALIKQLLNMPAVLHVSGEFGHDIAFMATDKNGPHATLRQQMTRLYSKSGAGSIAGGIAYSDAASNASIEGSVSYSIIGESTPGTFFEALNGKMMADGFMSRFLVIEYDGPRPPENEARDVADDQWGKWFADLAMEATRKHLPTPATPTEGATALLKAFNQECDDQINATEDEARRQMWNRAHLKALKVGALLAVADNPHMPAVTEAQAQWAVDLVRRDIRGMNKRLDGGDVGDGDDARRQKVLTCIRDWRMKELGLTYRNKRGWLAMQENDIVPRAYLTNRLQSLPLFVNHRGGAIAGVDQIVGSLVRDGVLMPVEKTKVADIYGTTGDAYRILQLD